ELPRRSIFLFAHRIYPKTATHFSVRCSLFAHRIYPKSATHFSVRCSSGGCSGLHLRGSPLPAAATEPDNRSIVMKRRKTLFAAALLAAACIAPAFAGDASVDTQQTASTGKADAQTVLSAMGASEASSSAIRKAIEVKSVHVIDVSSLTGTGSSLEGTIMRN